MKIRIKGNSIRIRLSKTEVATFGATGYLEEQTTMPTGELIYALAKSDTATTLSAGMEGNKVTMYVPASIVAEWTSSDTVGYNATIDNGKEGGLFLLLEKDFKCIDNEVMEDQSDNYDNPLHTCN